MKKLKIFTVEELPLSNHMKTQRFFKIISFCLLLSLSLSACSLRLGETTLNNPIVPHPDWELDNGNESNDILSVKDQLVAQSKIKKFDNEEELAEFLENNNTSSYGGDIGLRNAEMMEKSFTVGEAMPMADMATSKGLVNSIESNGGSDDFSKTNVQIEGVDEADIIKTDGKYIYAISKNSLFIIDALPADKTEILAKIEFESRPNDLYINGDSLVVFGRDNEIYNNSDYKRFRRRSEFTFFKVFDIKDPKNPKQVRDLDMEGTYTNSRLIGDYVYFVTTSYNYRHIENEPILPRIIEDNEVVTTTCAKGAKCFNPDIYYFDIPYDSYNFTSITAINVVDNTRDVTGDVYLMSRSQNMFVSTDNIYLTYTKYISEHQLEMEVIREIVYPKLSEKDRDRVAKIESVDNFILNRDEKIRKIAGIIERFGESLGDDEQEKIEEELDEKMKQKYVDISKELEKTVIHKIAINKGNLNYKTTGEVTGHVLNQFSMDEHDGYFRIATTKNRTWSRYDSKDRESYSNLYILDENLKQVGAVEKLAKGERIFSVRFMQGRAYMVTFKQTDPLFVIDLSNPRKPTVLGELKIPGFSNYLHPYDENTLIGIGQDTSENEWGGVRTKGVKLSLFDVGDVGNPKEIDTYVMGDAGSNSMALNDHKAFLFSLDKNLLVLPVSIQESISSDGARDKFMRSRTTFRGAAVFEVTKDGFELAGRIDHSNDDYGEKRDYWEGYSYYDSTVKRSLYIDNVLYTFSNKYLMMNNLNDLALVKKLELKKEKGDDQDDFSIVN